MLDFVVILLIFIIGFHVKKAFKAYLTAEESKSLTYLWIYHFSFGIIYWAYISYVAGGDAIYYYKVARETSLNEIAYSFISRGPGSVGIFALCAIPAKFLSFFTISLLFTLLGYVGITFFFVLILRNVKYNSRLYKFSLVPLLFFLPNLHFWSAGLGKDTLSFMCIGMFVYGMQNPKKHLIKIILALGLVYIIRPHITIFLVASFGIAFALDGKLKAYQKALVISVFLVAFIVLFEKFLNFVNIENLDTASIEAFSDKKADNLSGNRTGSGVDISSYPYPLKVLTFLYRPFFFDINGVLAIVASFENLILLLLSLKFFKTNPIRIWKKSNYLFKGMFIFFMIGTLSFSLILGNLGIMLREKNMFIPAFFFICLWAFSYKQVEDSAKMQNLN